MAEPAQKPADGPKRILVIDDSALSRQMLDEALKPRGFEVLMASDGEEGFLMFKRTSPHLILMDVVMPQMNGWETCVRIRRAAQSQAVPIIIMTSKNTPQDMLQSFEVGADEFIAKPINLDELFTMIGRLLSSNGGAGSKTP